MQLLIQFAGGRDLRLSSSSTNVSHKKTFRIGSKCIPLTYIFLRCVLIAGRQGDEKITGERCRARIIQPEGIKSNFFFFGDVASVSRVIRFGADGIFQSSFFGCVC